MDSFLTTLYFAYFRAKQRTNQAKVNNGLPKAAGEFDSAAMELAIAQDWEAEIEALLTEYTLKLKAGGK